MFEITQLCLTYAAMHKFCACFSTGLKWTNLSLQKDWCKAKYLLGLSTKSTHIMVNWSTMYLVLTHHLIMPISSQGWCSD